MLSNISEHAQLKHYKELARAAKPQVPPSWQLGSCLHQPDAGRAC
jgi:hypothetical protein